jgi:RNA polymerase sigma factor (sigma-70 family)
MSLRSRSDQQLIDDYQCGCQSSLEILIHRYKRRVFGFLVMLVKDQHLAEDLFQDTFIKVINSLKVGDYHDEGRFIAWVFRIAHNVTMDHFRVSKRITYITNKEDGDIFENIHVKEHTVEEILVVEQIHQELQSLLKFLPTNQQEIIIMRHHYNMTYSEIADELGISTNTATGRMRHALIGIRKLIKEKEIIITR